MTRMEKGLDYIENGPKDVKCFRRVFQNAKPLRNFYLLFLTLAPDWDTVNVCPAIVMLPVRFVVVVFGETE